jgi:hypothetical protein
MCGPIASLDTTVIFPDENDPIIAEVRRIREEIAAKCGHDIRRIFEYAHQQAKRFDEEQRIRRQRQESGE